MFDRPDSQAERVILVHPGIGTECAPDAISEFGELAYSSGASVVAAVTANRRRPDPRYYIGGGKVEEIAGLVALHQGDLVLVDAQLTPAQERNLEQRLQCRVLDRTGLILDIFAQRARSFEGKLQVELAQLTHLATRLVRGWTHLERQKGGIGLRGPGETQLEMDRRLIGGRIRRIRDRLARVHRQREQGRRARQARETATVSLVGYTNTGKSTLFRHLVEPDAHVADQLFATLDPTLRKLELPHGHSAVLADTVGFVRELPHELVEAFRSTLDETRDAALLLHVIDASDDVREQRIGDVETVLAEIGANEVPRLEVFNKIDCADRAPGVEFDENGVPVRAWVSALTGAGIPELVDAIARRLGQNRIHGSLALEPDCGRLRSRLFEAGAVLDESVEPDGSIRIEVAMERVDWERIAAAENIDVNCLVPVRRVAGAA